MLDQLTTLSSVARVVMDTLKTDYGVAPAPVFKAAGLDGDKLYAPRARYPVAEMQRLWLAAKSASGDPCFGLRVGANVRPTTLAVLGVAWLASDTLRDALRRLCRYSRMVSAALDDLRFEKDPQQRSLSWMPQRTLRWMLRLTVFLPRC